MIAGRLGSGGQKQWLGPTEYQPSVGAFSLLAADPFAIAATQDTFQPTVLASPPRGTPTQDAITVSPTIPDDTGSPTHMNAEFPAGMSSCSSDPVTQAACEEILHEDLPRQQHDQGCLQSIESIEASQQPVTTKAARLGSAPHRIANRSVSTALEPTAVESAVAEEDPLALPARPSPAAEEVADEAMPCDASRSIQVCDPQRKQSPVRTSADPLLAASTVTPEPDSLQSQAKMLEIGLSADGRYSTLLLE